jgi:hypothetical protein
MLPRRAARRPAPRQHHVVVHPDVRRVGRADRVVAGMSYYKVKEYRPVVTMRPHCWGDNNLCIHCQSKHSDWVLFRISNYCKECAPPYSIPAAAHEAPAEARECSCCNNKVWPNAFVCCDCYADGCRTYVSYPDTARRILDMGRTQQAAPVPQQPVDERAAGVARAVKNLSNHEKRLGASRFQP